MQTQADIAFQGGGARGIVLNGAMLTLERHGILPRRVVGTSAGAIAAVAVAAGYTGHELARMSLEKTASGKPIFASFLDRGPHDSWPPGTHARCTPSRFEAYGGVYTGGGFVQWLRRTLEAKRQGLGRATLREFYEQTGSHLSLVASDVTANRMLVLNHRTAPRCPAVWAVRMSMSIPFFFEEIVWQPTWGRYLGEDIAGAAVVDGGIISNFPLRLVLPSDNERIHALMGPSEAAPCEAIGLMIDASLCVPDAPPRDWSLSGAVLSLLGRERTMQRLARVANTALDGNDVTEEFAHRKLVCHLPAKGYDATDFSMSDARVRALLSGGELACREYLARRFAR
ncbi:MAG: patatin-like phospholipase family protein [Deltaproteobacteria bacterium]|nr:patatin-like phospholipase family protein [Deltaproteobacteria bacterium]